MRRRSTFLFATMLACAAPAIGMSSCGNEQFTGSGDAGTDAANDGTIGDGSSSDAQSSDASSDATLGPFCTSMASPPFFCADFDEGDFHDAYQSGASMNLLHDETDGGSVSAPGGGESLPNALFSTVPSAASAEAVTTAVLAPTGEKTHYRLDLDFKFDDSPPAPPVGGLQLFALELDQGGTSSSVTFSVSVNLNGLNVDIADPGITYTRIGDAPPAGKWTHATIDVRFDSNIVIFLVEGITPQKMSIGEGIQYDTPIVSLGLVSPGGISAVGVQYDDVTLVVDDAADGG